MVQLNRNVGSVEGQQKSTKIIMLAVVFVVALIGVGFYVFYLVNAPTPAQKSMPIPEKIIAPDATLTETVPFPVDREKRIDKKVAEPSFLLPDLDNSDPIVRKIAPSVTGHSAFALWLVPDELIRKFTLVIDNMSRGDLTRKHLKHFVPKQPFKVRELADGVYMMDPASYRRFGLFVDTFDSLDPRITIALYLKLQPLFQEAYEELGYPDQDFDQVLLAATDIILGAPVITRPLKFDRRSVMFKFADKKLENLNAVHKQMIRMGPENTKKIQAKIRAFVKLLSEAKS